LSYQLTQRFGLAHGHAVALTLGHVGAANALVTAEDCSNPRGPADVRKRVKLAASLFHCLPEDLPQTVKELVEKLGLPATLRTAGVPGVALAELARSVDPVRLGNNPRRLSVSQIEQLLQAAWQ
jgi:phosphonoacetaldehyde reductase